MSQILLSFITLSQLSCLLKHLTKNFDKDYYMLEYIGEQDNDCIEDLTCLRRDLSFAFADKDLCYNHKENNLSLIHKDCYRLAE